ncbi:cytochrome P450 [Dentipellis sp. KUC8613]|nr:cytochrome P450 [Dentipellis sp. KUC8613]
MPPTSSLVDAFVENKTTGAALVLLLVLLGRTLYRRLHQGRGNLPPSPRGLPLIGHLHLMPSARPWVWYRQLANEFKTPLTYLNLAGQDVIIVNDYQAGIDLLDKRSANYSSRPRLVIAGDYGSESKRIVFLPYGEAWRNHRSAFHRDMTPQKAASYVPIQAAEVKLLMRRMLHTPATFIDNFKMYSASVILKICYGLDSESENKKVISDLYEISDMFLESAVPGTNLVDLFPTLDNLPNFLAPWRAPAMHQRRVTQNVFVGLVRDVIKRVGAGELAPDGAFTARLWHDRKRFAMDELDIAYLAGTMFEAGTDTTAASLSTFIMAAAANPIAFRTAQAEIDAVCGEHAPGMEDMGRLPYVLALCKEVLRWRSVAAGGLPHLATTTEDDYYEGYRIPAGALLMPNQFGMGLSQETYGQKYDAELFEPRRWLERPEGVGDILEGHPAFGFGRRVCPGKHLAGQSLFLVVSNMCFYFDIAEKEGAPVDTQRYTPGFIMQPEPFECSIVPRKGREAEIESEAEAAREALRNL